MKTIVITGANRGIGLGLAQCFLNDGHKVIATARNPANAPELNELAKDNAGMCSVVTLDVASDVSVQGFAQIVEEHGQVDVLVNNAGTIGEGGASFAECSFDAVQEAFNVNTLGPMRVTRSLLPMLKKSNAPVVASITSQMGSIADNSSGGFYGYRTSKAALNMFNKSFAMDFDQITAVVLHPGWVQTDMGGQGAPTSVAESAAGLAKLILNAKKSDSGKFLNYKGEPLPW